MKTVEREEEVGAVTRFAGEPASHSRESQFRFEVILMVAKNARLAEVHQGKASWRKWRPYLAKGSGEPYARTTATPAMPGFISPMIKPAHALIDGERMA